MSKPFKNDPPRRPDLGNREQVRRLKKAMDRNASGVVRCQQCGHQQMAEAAMIGPRSECDRCSTPLHSCRHCQHFDTGARFQCRKTIEKPVSNKGASNDCSEFEARVVLDSTGKRMGGRGKPDAKSKFDSLFKS